LQGEQGEDANINLPVFTALSHPPVVSDGL